MMTVKEWFANRYTSLTGQTVRERMAIRTLRKHKEFHSQMHQKMGYSYRNKTEDQKRILNGQMLGLLP